MGEGGGVDRLLDARSGRSAGPRASRRASLATRSGNSSSGATWVTRPASSASVAESGSASSAIRIARARPIEAATVADEPPSVISPIRAKGSRNAADSAATMMSEARAAEQATPAAIAVDRREHRPGQDDDGPDHPVGAVHRLDRVLRREPQRRHVGAGAEARAGAGDDHDAHVVATARALELRGQRHHHRAVDGVEDLGPVEGQPQHAVLDADLEVRQRRHPPPASRPARPRSSPARRRRTGRRAAGSRTPRPPRPARSPARSSRWRSRRRRPDVTSWARSQSASPTPSTVAALEAGVRRRVLALEEDRVERLRVEVGVERLAVGADPAVHRPRVGEVGLPRPVRARVDVVVLGRHDVVVRRRLGSRRRPGPEQRPDVGGDPARRRRRAASRPRRSRSGRR